MTALRKRTQVPFVLMAYYNTIHAFGEKSFCFEAAKAGVDGLIVPDMPPEEAGLLVAADCEGGPYLIPWRRPAPRLDLHKSRNDRKGSSITCR